jgi:hypothetical protein
MGRGVTRGYAFSFRVYNGNPATSGGQRRTAEGAGVGRRRPESCGGFTVAAAPFAASAMNESDSWDGGKGEARGRVRRTKGRSAETAALRVELMMFLGLSKVRRSSLTPCDVMTSNRVTP